MGGWSPECSTYNPPCQDYTGRNTYGTVQLL
nr:MAG TPA: hypothetical protein [Caudoviricetes sp.]